WSCWPWRQGSRSRGGWRTCAGAGWAPSRSDRGALPQPLARGYHRHDTDRGVCMRSFLTAVIGGAIFIFLFVLALDGILSYWDVAIFPTSWWPDSWAAPDSWS